MYDIADCKLGLYEKSMPRALSLEQKLRMARGYGYDFMELSIDAKDDFLSRLDMPRAQRAELRRITGDILPINTICFSGSLRFPLGAASQVVRSRGLELAKKSVDLANDLGIRIVQYMCSDEATGAERTERSRELFMENLYRFVRYASGGATMIALENLDDPFSRSLYQVLDIVEKIDSPWLQMYSDEGNLNGCGFSAEEVNRQYETAGRHIIASHIKDTYVGTVRNTPYGAGSVDFISFFRTLRRMEFTGLMVLEFWDQEDGNYESALSSSLAFVKDRLARSV